MPESRCYFYQDSMLPVLLDSLRGDWQANELARPLARLKAMDNNGLLRRTLAAWFRHNVQPLATSKALFIHRNTLEYRLNRISELTGLDLGNLMTGCCCMWRCSWMKSGRLCVKVRRRWLIPLSPKGRGECPS
ncbi:helix-turn-helix domain-containing protein [Escherichia coli]